jgi:hypothetical protein
MHGKCDVKTDILFIVRYILMLLASLSSTLSVPPKSPDLSAMDPEELPPPLSAQSDPTCHGEPQVTAIMESVDADGQPPCQSTSSAGPGDFSPVHVRPHPKANHDRKVGKGRGRKRHSAILTDTPEKKLLMEHNYGKKKLVPAVKKQILGKKKIPQKISVKLVSARKKSINRKDDTDDEDVGASGELGLCDDDSNDDLPDPVDKDKLSRPQKRSLDDFSSANDNCVICGEFGRGGETWFRCVMCGFWAHQLCSGVDRPDAYICDHCQ